MRILAASVLTLFLASHGNPEPVGVTTCTSVSVQDPGHALNEIKKQILEAQSRWAEAETIRLVKQAVTVLGENAGRPEIEDKYLPVPQKVKPITAEEIRAGFLPYLERLPRYKWWKRGLEPATTEHLPREVANVICGLLAAYRAGVDGEDECMAQAKEAGDYLIWTQQQAGTGAIPFPASRNGTGPAFESGQKLLRTIERAGKMNEAVRNGWLVEDFEDGGLQFDNGECGLALFELYEATKDEKYLVAAKSTADWALSRPVVPNWNYNSFSVYLLSTAYRVTGDKRYLDGAKLKARLGIYPGQLKEGSHRGRWADPHNARPEYHYIIARSLAGIIVSMDKSDPDREEAVTSLRLALQARNKEIVERGIMTVEKSFEALWLSKKVPETDLQGCFVGEAFDAVASAMVENYRAGRLPAPVIWGRYLEYLSK